MKVIARAWPPVLDIEKAADYLSVSESTVRLWIEEKTLRTCRLPGTKGNQHLDRVHIKIEELDKLKNEATEI